VNTRNLEDFEENNDKRYGSQNIPETVMGDQAGEASDKK